MHGVEALGLLLGQAHPLLRDDAQTGFLEAGVDLARQVAAGGVRLDDRQGALDGHDGSLQKAYWG
ncbi:hypothetical protein AUP43_14660 [Oceanibaculum pacificum]|uniref:Uncharacterized protein n=1 Tax=Oceanibaculum pacificum TaxID=580166 RepID=A0A154VC55_9PROT|nr:hypothetical protein AUP43_14660 [Oceanibaculum pacificum]